MYKAEYLENPCRAASLPYWKTAVTSVPEHMAVVHQEDFRKEDWLGYDDDPYFRIMHDLTDLCPPVLPAGFCLRDVPLREFASHVNRCYPDISVTPSEMERLAPGEVFNPSLRVAVVDNATGALAATGIAGLDRGVGEGFLEWIQVSPALRRRGLGAFVVRELLWRLKGAARFVTVSGRMENPTNPEALYRACGFTGGDVWHILTKKRDIHGTP